MTAKKKRECLYLQFLGPENVHRKGIGGQQALHLAMKNNDWHCIKILLDLGASVNAGDDEGVTPFHLCCKKRFLPLLHRMLQHDGADVNVVDNKGHGPIHYAVQGGYVFTIHYLVEVCHLSLHQHDYNCESLLHLACVKKNKLVLDYLLQKQRSNINDCDSVGNSVMHFAAKSGWNYACCRLLELRAEHLLHLANFHGDKPQDLARRAGHKETVKLLDYYASLQWITPRTDMVVEWYSMLSLPVIVYINSALLANCVNYPGTVIVIMMIFYVALHKNRSTQISQTCGWPNPIMAGLFGSGFIYTVFVIYQYLSKGLYSEHPFFAFAILTLTSFFCCAYYALLRIEPGVCMKSLVVDGQMMTIKDMDSKLCKTRHFCPVCEIIQPDGVRHCNDCGQCFYKWQCHSSILHRCIAIGNCGLYTVFLGLSILVSVIFFSIIITQFEPFSDYLAHPTLWPLIVGHYFSVCINLKNLILSCKDIPALMLRQWRRSAANTYFV